MSTKVFGASWDRTLIVSTLVLATITIAAAALMLRTPLTQQGGFGWYRGVALTGAIGIIAVVVAAALAAPRRFLVTKDAVVIQRWLGAITIPGFTITDVQPLSREHMRGSFKSIGNSGMFGTYGRFSNDALGEFRMYATRHDAYVLIRTTGDPFVITPDSDAAFIKAAQAIAGS